MKKLILIRGLPGSGKSTLAARFLLEPGDRHLEADQWFVRDGVYQRDPSMLFLAHRWCIGETYRTLAAGHTAVVTNTFVTEKELVPYFKCAARNGIVPVVLVAQNDWGNVHGVPEETMARMRTRFKYDIKQMFDGLAQGYYGGPEDLKDPQ